MSAQTIVSRCGYCRTAEEVATGVVTSSLDPAGWARMCAGRKGGTCRNPYPIAEPSTVDELIAALDAAVSENEIRRAHERYTVALGRLVTDLVARPGQRTVLVDAELLRDLVALAERAVR